jgi:hypothetical protein
MWILPKKIDNCWSWNDSFQISSDEIVTRTFVKAGTIIPIFGRFIRFQATKYVLNASTIIGIDDKTCLDGCISENPKESIDSINVPFHGLGVWPLIKVPTRTNLFGNTVCTVFEKWHENKNFEPLLLFFKENPTIWHAMIQSLAIEKMDGIGYHEINFPVLIVMEDLIPGTPLQRIFGRYPQYHPLCLFYFSAKDKRVDSSPLYESQSLLLFLSELVKIDSDIWTFLYQKLIVHHGLVLKCPSIEAFKKIHFNSEWLRIMFHILKTNSCPSPAHLF